MASFVANVNGTDMPHVTTSGRNKGCRRDCQSHHYYKDRPCISPIRNKRGAPPCEVGVVAVELSGHRQRRR